MLWLPLVTPQMSQMFTCASPQGRGGHGENRWGCTLWQPARGPAGRWQEGLSADNALLVKGCQREFAPVTHEPAVVLVNGRGWLSAPGSVKVEEPACRSPGLCPKPRILPALWASPAPQPGERVREAGVFCPARWAHMVTTKQPGPLPPGPVVAGSRGRHEPSQVCRHFCLHSDRLPLPKSHHPSLSMGSFSARSHLMIR